MSLSKHFYEKEKEEEEEEEERGEEEDGKTWNVYNKRRRGEMSTISKNKKRIKKN